MKILKNYEYMNPTRHDFLKGVLAALGFSALPGGLFAAPKGWMPKKKPNLVFGILSDTHLMVEWDGNPDCRVYAYNIVVVGDDPKARYFKSEYFSGVNSAVGHEPDGGVTTVEIPASELPAGKNLTIAVRPISSLGTKGKTIGTTWRV